MPRKNADADALLAEVVIAGGGLSPSGFVADPAAAQRYLLDREEAAAEEQEKARTDGRLRSLERKLRKKKDSDS